MAAAAPASGPAHVAAASFLAARVAPAGGFWIALAGGLALARTAQRRGAREGFGASAAAMLETVAIMGPARFGVPLTQAVTAPILGRLEARGVGAAAQTAVCALVRLAHNVATTAFFIWVIAGGLDAYAGSYDALARRIGVPLGSGGALGLTAAGLLAWAAFASAVQVLVYRRGLHDWGDAAIGDESAFPAPQPPPAQSPRFDPRAVALAAAVVFGLLLASTEWVLLGAAAGWLAAVWAASRPDPRPLGPGAALAGLLALGALVFALGGGLGLDVALRRAARAALLVLAATWLRAAAGSEGLREVARRALGRARRVPAAAETVRALDEIGGEGRMTAAGRSLLAALAGVPRRALPILDAVLAWVASESARFRPAPPGPRPRLRVRSVDVCMVALLALPAAALFAAV